MLVFIDFSARGGVAGISDAMLTAPQPTLRASFDHQSGWRLAPRAVVLAWMLATGAQCLTSNHGLPQHFLSVVGIHVAATFAGYEPTFPHT